jgi:hypothetical protein
MKYEDNKEFFRQRSLANYYAKRAEKLAYGKEYYQKNKDSVREYYKEWFEKNKDERNAARRARYAILHPKKEKIPKPPKPPKQPKQPSPRFAPAPKKSRPVPTPAVPTPRFIIVPPKIPEPKIIYSDASFELSFV